MKRFIKPIDWVLISAFILFVMLVACKKTAVADTSGAMKPSLPKNSMPVYPKSPWYSERLIRAVLVNGLTINHHGKFYKTIATHIPCAEYKLPSNCHEKFFTFTSYGYGLEIVVNDLTNIRIDEN